MGGPGGSGETGEAAGGGEFVGQGAGERRRGDASQRVPDGVDAIGIDRREQCHGIDEIGGDLRRPEYEIG